MPLQRIIVRSGLLVTRLKRNKQQYQSFVGLISNLELASYFSWNVVNKLMKLYHTWHRECTYRRRFLFTSFRLSNSSTDVGRSSLHVRQQLSAQGCANRFCCEYSIENSSTRLIPEVVNSYRVGKNKRTSDSSLTFVNCNTTTVWNTK